MKNLDTNKIYSYQEGRVLEADTGGAVKDVILTGLHSLTEGEKTPLTEYNEAFKRLQRRRRMKSIAEQAKEQAPEVITTVDPSHGTNLLVEPQTVSQSASGDIHEEGAEISDQVNDEEEPTEIERILDELADGIDEPTLPRLSDVNVALDMDEVIIEVQAEKEDWSDASEDSEESGNDD
jgi:hypothetical protein